MLLKAQGTSFSGGATMKKNSNIDKKIKKKKTGLIFIIFLLLISIFFILYTKTSFFHISNIEVFGNEQISDDKLILASGVTTGENIFKINLKSAKENIKLHPYTKNVKVKRKLPNKIAIHIEERKEAAVIVHIGSYIYIDDEGIILNILSEKKDNKCITISNLEIEEAEIGKEIIFNNDEMNNLILEFIDSCTKLGLAETFNQVSFDEDGEITIYLENGQEVAFGTLDDVKYKLNFLQAILKELESNNQRYKAIHLDKGNNAIIIKDND